MELNILLLLIFFQGILAYNYTTKYFEVPVDHFSFSNNATFMMKYLINDTYWLDDGPIFFYTGNEGTIESFAENTGFIFDIAPIFNALIVFAEHRYYGTTLPFGNMSYSSPQYLGYLTSSQALADYVDLIHNLQLHYANSEVVDELPVVAFGGSYGGMLASWLRMKYPSSVIGAIAASAPIWQFEGLTPCENFNRIVTDVFKTASALEDCSTPLQKAWKVVRNVTATADGKTWLSNEWKLCTPLQNGTDVDTIISWLSNIYTNLVMVNYPYPTSFLVPLPAEPVRVFCSKLTGTGNMDDKALLTALGGALEVYTNYTGETQCNNIAQTAPDLGEQGWYFQACTEMIMPFCSTDDDMFENLPWNFTAYAEECYKTWGVKQFLAEYPILEYGGKDIGAASNIVFSNGLLDPWSSGGVLSNVSSTVSAIVIPEGAHHLDFRGANRDDPESVIEARNFHVQTIKKWLSEHYETKYSNSYKKWRMVNKHVEYVRRQ